jgi:hypothetical protein
MQSVQYRNMTDEELIRQAYIKHDDPLVLELCARIARLLDDKADLEKEFASRIPH